MRAKYETKRHLEERMEIMCFSVNTIFNTISDSLYSYVFLANRTMTLGLYVIFCELTTF
jgi:hypothetical protein